MDQREHQLQQSLSVCNRLFNFLMKNIASHAFKTVTLGRPVDQELAKAQNRSPMVHPMPQQETPGEGVKQDIDVESLDLTATVCSPGNNQKQDLMVMEVPVLEANGGDINQGIEDDEAPLPSQAKPPKKVVSINDRVEEITPVSHKKKLRRKKSTEKSTSLEQEDHDPKPLRSILKVGSDLGGRSSSFVNPAGDG